jgi:RNA polymerase sporulation-specific sigma factor
MNNKDISDSELINLANEESEEAKEILFEKYQYIINLIIKKYIIASKKYNVEYNDLYQEALVGFTDAINRYNDTSSSLPTFITLCVDRRLQVIIKKASRLKNKIMNSSLSLEHVYDNYEQPLMDLLSDENKNNPLHNLEDDENCKVLINEIEKNLSSNEKEVFYLMLKNYNYLEIAEILNKTSKQIDNCIQRIKSKSKNILNKKTY